MRNELAELLGQPVVLAGRLNRCEPNPIGSLNICLKAVDVYRWRTDVAISSLPPVRVDHGWLQMPSLEHSMGGIVEMYWMTAEISNYQRKNGSRDIGFSHRPSLCLDHLLNKILNIDEYNQQVEIIRDALRRIKNRDDIFGFHCTPQQMEATLKQTLLTSQRVNPYALKNHLKAHVSRLKDARNKSPLRQHNAIKTSGFNANS